MADVVIAARNEAKTIGAIVDAWVAASVGKVIVVDDCSTDSTAAIAASRGATVVAGPHLGKGQAMEVGLEYVQSDRVTFCDGDLTGFTTVHARSLSEPYDGQVCGILDNGSGLFSSMVPPITGQRTLPTWLARSVKLVGWQAETQLNAAVARQRLPVRHVLLSGVLGTYRIGPFVVARILPSLIVHASDLVSYGALL